MDTYQRGELRFDVLDVGPADGPVVLLLHGFPELNVSWEPLMSRLATQGYRCLAPNQRGYSPTARPRRRRDYRAPELVADIVALIDAVGADRVHLVGHDWGGAVAWSVAQRYPDRLASLTVLSVPHPAAFFSALLTSRQALASWYMLFFQLPRIPEWYIMNRRGHFTLTGFRQSRPASAAALTDEEAAAISEPGALTAALNWYRAVPLSLSREVTAKVSVPTLFIWGDEDMALLRSSAERCGQYVAGEYRFEPLDGVSHWIMDERPDTVAELLLDWMRAHP